MLEKKNGDDRERIANPVVKNVVKSLEMRPYSDHIPKVRRNKTEITMKNPVVKTKIGSEYWFLEQSKRIHGRVILKTDVQNGLF